MSSNTQYSNAKSTLADNEPGLVTANTGTTTIDSLQQQQQQQQQDRQTATAALSAGASAVRSPTPPRKEGGLPAVVGSRLKSKSKTWVDTVGARDDLKRMEGTAGTRLLQITRFDLSRAPFHASPEVSIKFRRSLRILRLHAFAAAALKQYGVDRQQHHGNANDGGRCGGDVASDFRERTL